MMAGDQKAYQTFEPWSLDENFLSFLEFSFCQSNRAKFARPATTRVKILTALLVSLFR
jgi:hypothetical protein